MLHRDAGDRYGERRGSLPASPRGACNFPGVRLSTPRSRSAELRAAVPWSPARRPLGPATPLFVASRSSRPGVFPLGTRGLVPDRGCARCTSDATYCPAMPHKRIKTAKETAVNRFLTLIVAIILAAIPIAFGMPSGVWVPMPL